MSNLWEDYLTGIKSNQPISEEMVDELKELSSQIEIPILQTSIENIAKEIEKANRAYWVDNNPIMSDSAYDALVEELRKLDPNHPMLSEIHDVHLDERKLDPPVKMMSLHKMYDLESIWQWARKLGLREVIVEPKYDGSSGCVFSGFRQMCTRGRLDISNKIPHIEFILAPNEQLPIQGEILISKSFFEEHLADEYRNPRNAVPGFLGRKNPNEVEGKGLTFLSYNAGHQWKIKVGDDAEFKKVLLEAQEGDWLLDGMVIKVADKAYREDLGFDNYGPRWAVAFKFKNPSVQTRVERITYSMGKTGALTPIAWFEPVDLDGVTITKAKAHNQGMIETMGLWPGCDVVVERAGAVIPQVARVLNPNKNLVPILSHCPFCNTPVKRERIHILCPNSECPELLANRLLTRIRRLGVEEIQLGTLSKLMKEFKAKTIFDLMQISKHDIANLEGMGRRSAEIIVTQLQKIIEPKTPVQLFRAFNVDGIGRSFAEIALARMSWSELFIMPERIFPRLDGIGPKNAAKWVAVREECRLFYKELLNAGFQFKVEDKVALKAEAKSFCLTGKLDQPRTHYQALIREAGHKVETSVKKGLDYLVQADPSSQSAKTKKAIKNGVQVISLEQMLELIK